MRWVWFAVLMLVALASTGAQRDPAKGPQVLHAEFPDCETVAGLGLQGRVSIRVQIDKQGRVTSSAIEDGPAFEAHCSEAAAKRWLFAPSDRDGAREALLSFVFPEDPEDPRVSTTLIWSLAEPFTVRLGYADASTRWLPREDGRVPEKRCPVHGEVMATEAMGVRYGLPADRILNEHSPEDQRLLAEWKAYDDAKPKLFPWANLDIQGGCMPREPRIEVYYCQACREAEREWLANHPGFEPTSPRFIRIPVAKDPKN